jgi:menaquinone-dependent protoporphyrinogen oxidase
MNSPILVAYATERGSTKEVAEAIAEQLTADGLAIDVRAAEAVDDLAPYGAVVLGTALYMGRIHRDARAFLAAHRASLGSVPFAVFGLGPRTLAEDDVAGSRRQLEKSVAKVGGLSPFATAVFGGVIDPAKLRFPFSRFEASDARDWEAIAAWTSRIAPRLDAPATDPAAHPATTGSA